MLTTLPYQTLNGSNQVVSNEEGSYCHFSVSIIFKIKLPIIYIDLGFIPKGDYNHLVRLLFNTRFSSYDKP